MKQTWLFNFIPKVANEPEQSSIYIKVFYKGNFLANDKDIYGHLW